MKKLYNNNNIYIYIKFLMEFFLKIKEKKKKKKKKIIFNTTTVDNFYYDEESEVSKAESSKISNYYGDSPSTHPISDSEEEYVYSDGEGAHDVSLINQITNKSRSFFFFFFFFFL